MQLLVAVGSSYLVASIARQAAEEGHVQHEERSGAHHSQLAESSGRLLQTALLALAANSARVGATANLR